MLSRLKSLLGAAAHDAAPSRLPSPDELVLLTRPQGEPEAQLLRQILQDNGIRSMVKNRDAVGVDGGGWGPSWAYELWVLRKDLRRARETLDLPAPKGPP
ncbi:MAG: putative signal transducing protein [Dehalococcoidia bacterium]